MQADGSVCVTYIPSRTVKCFTYQSVTEWYPWVLVLDSVPEEGAVLTSFETAIAY